jgi:hypothetical protein
VLHEAAPHGLAPLTGSAPQVGVVSYTLGGGLGVLGRRWGFSADHVRRLDVVTADGVLRRGTADEHPDLFWALRGGGGNLGVVTAMQIELVELAQLYGGGLFFPGEDAGAVLSALLTVGHDAPDEVSLSAAVMVFPDLPAVPPPLRGRWCCHVRVSSTGTPSRCEEVIAPVRQAATPLADTVRTMPVTEVGTIHNDPTTARATNSRSLVLHTPPTTTPSRRSCATPGPALPSSLSCASSVGRWAVSPRSPTPSGTATAPTPSTPPPTRTPPARRPRTAPPSRRCSTTCGPGATVARWSTSSPDRT